MKQNEQGVSPVVGVMLMLAVTIMIAAIVSATAGGLSGTQKKAPDAILDVTIFSSKDYGGYNVSSLMIRHISGNVLPTRDIRLVMYYRNPVTGTLNKGDLIGQQAVPGDAAWTTRTVTYTADQYCGVLFINDANRFGTKNNPVRDSATGNDNWFGNPLATFAPGDILVTPAQFCGPDHSHNTGMEYLFPGVNFQNADKEFPAGSTVTVKIIHNPSGQVIFDKDVIIL
ncbi:type IV pilin N-terminal domain-containing protein [Methanoregula sp.]|uniref:type IV pilin N-terminal domain-containing protein n=1 Tax=Methanoregula sp. TaxID=2052170 RepID=UPI003562FBDD